MKAAELNVWMSVKLWVTDIQSLTKKNNTLKCFLVMPGGDTVFLESHGKKKQLSFVHVLHLSDVSFTKLLGTVMVGKEARGLLFVKEDGWTVIVGQWLHCLYRLTDENHMYKWQSCFYNNTLIKYVLFKFFHGEAVKLISLVATDRLDRADEQMFYSIQKWTKVRNCFDLTVTP